MTTFFDCRFIRVEEHDGISRFSSELFGAISAKSLITALISDLTQLENLPAGTKFVLINHPKSFVRELLLPKKLNALGAKAVFSPMQTMGSLGKKYKLLLTLHDLIYYQHRTPPYQLSAGIRIVWRLFHLSFTPIRALLGRADGVVTISETTRELIIKHRLTTNPVHVVSNASSMQRLLAARKMPLSKNLVYMGSFMRYKNVELLMDSIALLPEFTLTLCSGISKKRKAQLLRRVHAADQTRVHFLDGVSDSSYEILLDNSFALVSASEDEGFGIPLIEAMSRAIPVIVSDLTIFREVAAEAGSYFNKSKVNDFVQRVNELDNTEKWKAFSQASVYRSAHYSWNKSADQLLRALGQARE